MSLMKKIRFNTGFLDSNFFKNAVITFGMCLSLFTITSFDSVSGKDHPSQQAASMEQSADSNSNQQESRSLTDQPAKQNVQKTHHNFIASYLLEESSAKKEEKNPESEIKILGQLLQLHKTIVTLAIGLL